jgi:hypothetical protein
MVRYQELFDYLKVRLAVDEGSDDSGAPEKYAEIVAAGYTWDFTEEFAEKHGLFWGELAQILEDMGYNSDEDVLDFAVRHIPGHEIIGHESFKTPREIAVEKGLFCHPHVDGKSVSWHEAFRAQEAGLRVEWKVPCTQDAPYAKPDLDRAVGYM